ncbi:MAG: hypothetical protein KatS3mg005_1395 [Bryobacteraceae bacterium]|nr:MAG: hypothetical protein KatS3mg005_1395 [Bryobacteraceae bacterium]
MSAKERFLEYLRLIEQRLRLRSLASGAAILAVLLLAVTAAAAWLALRYAFDPRVLLAGRIALVLAAGAGLALGIAAPLLRINRRRAARLAEAKLAGLEERAATLVGPSAGSPLAELVAEEALRHAEAVPPRALVGNGAIAAAGISAAAAIAVLVWFTAAAPGSLGYGAHLLWAGAPPAGQQALFELTVKPGDAKVRRGGDQLIEAVAAGFDMTGLRIRLRRPGAAQWETLSMEPSPSGGGFVFLIAGITEDVEYQVDAQRMRSPVYRLRVVDLPKIEKFRVRYRYPAYLGLPDREEDPGGDVRAIENTRALLEIETDKPLSGGVIVLDDGTRLPLQSEGRIARAELEVKRDGAFHFAALDGGAPVRLSEDYFIEAQPERAPEVRLTRPGRDAKVSPIEEVTVEAEAADDFGLQALEITYSVNGGEPRTIRLPVQRGAKEASGRAVIALEEFRLQPGDIVALSATARDARAAAQTDIFFLEAQPFEREFQQSQTVGGMSGMEGEGEDANDIVQRQKEIISATWNQIRSRKGAAETREDAAFLSGMQQKLAEQAQSLSQRMRSRQLAGTNEEFQKFSQEMSSASKAMQDAAARLRNLQWREALSPEQRALQHLLRAESIFRQIQVAFGQQGGGGGRGGGQMRDLESLFELELDLEKNQYETVQSASGAASRERQIDEALKKLEELARRQQQQAEQQRRNEQSFQQRWQQEMLRREAEELRRQLAELQRNQRNQSGQSGQEQQSQQGGQSSQGASGSSSGSQGQQRAGGPQSERLSRAQQQIERALEDMRRAQSAQGGEAQENARRAAERMSQALDELGSLRRQQTGDRMESLSRRASELAERQRRYEEQVRRLFPPQQAGAQQPGQPAAPASESEKLGREKEAMQREYQRLEQDLREAARALDSSQRGAAQRLREALGEAQQNELGLRMRLGAEWMRRGLGPYLAPRERVVTEALDRLRDQVEQARQLAGREGGGQQREQVERALGQLENLREQLQRQARAGRQQGQKGGEGRPQGQGQERNNGRQQGQQGNEGGQPGRGQDPNGQPGQGQQRASSQQEGDGRGGQRAGERMPGESRQGDRRQTGGDTSFWRGDYSALNDGSLQPDWSRSGDGGRGAWNEAMRQLRQLREEAAVSDETQAEIEQLLRRMQQLDPARFGSPLLSSRIENEFLPQLEQVELRLRKELSEQSGAPRAAPSAKAPPGYAEAVAEYFRRLSRGR